MTAALEGSEWSAARPGRSLPPGKTRYALYNRLDGPQGRSGRAEGLVPPGFDPRTIQPVDCRYTDYATRPTRQATLDGKIRRRKDAISLPDDWGKNTHTLIVFNTFAVARQEWLRERALILRYTEAYIAYIFFCGPTA